MFKKIEIILWILSAIFTYGVFLAVIYTDILVPYGKIFGVIVTVSYLNAAGVHIWNRIK